MSGEGSIIRYRPELDGLRAVAVLAVLFFHAGLGVPGGFVGVDVFFVLSGYLITSLIVRDLDSGTFTFAHFWERRARRILPASTFLVACTLLAGCLLLMPADFAALGNSALATALFGANVFFWRSVDYFSASADEMPLLHMWSLAVEEQFYFLVPLLFWMCSRSGRFTRAGLLVAVGVACTVSFGIATWMVPRMPAAAFYLLPARAWELGLGSLVALWPPAWMPLNRPARSAAAWIGLAGIGIPCGIYDQATPFPGVAALPPCFGAALYILSATQPSAFPLPLPVRVLASPPFVAVGLFSYSLYLWHWPLFAFARYWALEPLSLVTRISLCILSAIAAALSWWFVETPFRTRSLVPLRRALLQAAAGAIAFVAAAGFTVAFEKGFPQRFGPEMLELARDDLKTVAAPVATLANLRAGRLPVVGNPADPLVLLVWGDSHAMALLPAVEKVCMDEGVSAVFAVHSSTAPVLGYEHTDRYSRKEESPVFAAAVIEYVQKHRIPNVLLAARWSGYFEDEAAKGDSGPRIAGGEGGPFAEALCKTVSSLVAAGAQPYIFAEVPNHRVNVPKALRARVMFGLDTDRFCPSHNSHAARTSDLRRLAPSLVASRAIVIDASELLLSSNKQRYSMAERNVPLYLDAHHLSRDGAIRISPALIRCIATRPSSPSAQSSLESNERPRDAGVFEQEQ